MKLLDVLFTAGGGGVFGSVLHIVSSYFQTKQEIALMNAKVAAAEKEKAWEAFTASQSRQDVVQVIPGAAPWCATIAELCDAFRVFTRPALTWAFVALLFYIYFTATPVQRESLMSELLFGAFTAVSWWFGSRYSRK